MKQILVISAVFIINIVVSLACVNYTLNRVIEANELSRQVGREELIRSLLQHSAVADFIIPSGEYEGEQAEGVCLDAEGSSLLLKI
jgi:hypothetical protein